MRLVTDLFEPEPTVWGLRGDPHVWRAMVEHLTGQYLPPSPMEAEKLLYASFDRVAGVDLASETAPWIYREEFSIGSGLSDGNIHLDTWRTTLLPMLVDRARSKITGP